MKRKYHIQPGEKFGRLTSIRLDHVGNHNRSYFLFKCDCGKKKVILGSGVKSGNTRSCGCLSIEAKKNKRLPNNKGVINHLILQYKRHANRRGFDFNLSFDQFSDLISKPCFYCGLPPSNNKITKNCSGFVYSGIDRGDSKNGYTKENCVPCCDRCNRAKGNMDIEHFIAWVRRVYNHKKAMAEQWG